MDGAEPTSRLGMTRWPAELTARFERRRDRTVLAHQAHRGPLLIQRPFHPEPDGTCHVYTLHPPGGIAGGDVLRCDFHLGERSSALLTTPAATKVYRSIGPYCEQRQMLRVEADAALEWLPQESIVFDGARARLHTRIVLAPGARVAAWEILCLGRPAIEERFTTGELQQRVEIWREQRPLFIERALYTGGSPVLGAPWGLRGRAVSGCFVLTLDDPAAGLEEARALCAEAEQEPGALAAATAVEELLVCRYLGPRTEGARTCFEALWKALRPRCSGRQAVPPRIWAT